MTTLADTVHEHHDALLPRVDGLLETARLVGSLPCEELRPRVLETRAFLADMLIPHMEAAERAVYPRLEAILTDTGALGPLRREHQEVRRLVAELDRLCATHEGPYRRGEALALRRCLYRLHAIVRVHLDEEEMMAQLLAHRIDPEEATAIARDLAHAVTVPL
jgi:plasmid stabilization system protein ParE